MIGTFIPGQVVTHKEDGSKYRSPYLIGRVCSPYSANYHDIAIWAQDYDELMANHEGEVAYYRPVDKPRYVAETLAVRIVQRLAAVKLYLGLRDVGYHPETW